LTTTTFATLGLAEPILRALAAQNFTTPTPIQAGAIPALLEGHDLLGIAQTGTGKTAAFALPILQHLNDRPGRARPFGTRCLILAPTRELAIQIGHQFQGGVERQPCLDHRLVIAGAAMGRIHEQGRRPDMGDLTMAQTDQPARRGDGSRAHAPDTRRWPAR